MFFLHPTVPACAGDSLECQIEVVRRKDNQRLLAVKLQHKVRRLVTKLADKLVSKLEDTAGVFACSAR